MVPGKKGRMFSHATYWDGVRKKMSEIDALQEAVEWIWSIHNKKILRPWMMMCISFGYGISEPFFFWLAVFPLLGLIGLENVSWFVLNFLFSNVVWLI